VRVEFEAKGELVFVEGRLLDPEGRVVAAATATTRIIPFAPRGES
jgi:hypothetical protein